MQQCKQMVVQKKEKSSVNGKGELPDPYRFAAKLQLINMRRR